MRAVRLVVEPFEFINYTEVVCVRELNQHGTLRIRGLIAADKVAEYSKIAGKERWVCVKVVSETEEEQHFFDGVLTRLQIDQENQSSLLTIELKTGSFLLDQVPHTRSFQNVHFRYTDLIRTCLEPVAGQFIQLEKKADSIGHFLLQYQETDWVFLKRLASYAGMVVIPEDVTPGKKLYFGYKVKNTIEEMKADRFRQEQNYEAYQEQTASGKKGLHLQDFVSYVVRSREIYGLGETVKLGGNSFVIGKVTSWLLGQELYQEYHLIRKKEGLLPLLFHPNLSGVSLLAEVVAVEHTMVKVQIQEDENKEMCGSCWFDYATVYSTPDGTGWYCMPEVGDQVRLVFPDQKEEHAYVASSVHVGSSQGRTNPEQKSWKNKQKKEILFTPDAIVLRNNKGLLVELSDNRGISLYSNRDILIRADGMVRIASQEKEMYLLAKERIQMQQGAAKIQMKEDILMNGGNGGKIYLN